MEISNALAVGIGLGTVFSGLVALVFICYIMSSLVKAFSKSEKKPASAIPAAASATASAVNAATITNKGEFAAAVACAIAEDLGTDVTGIRIKSKKKYNKTFRKERKNENI